MGAERKTGSPLDKINTYSGASAVGIVALQSLADHNALAVHQAPNSRPVVDVEEIQLDMLGESRGRLIRKDPDTGLVISSMEMQMQARASRDDIREGLLHMIGLEADGSSFSGLYSN